ncbi:MAG: DinB family protein [Anaerolineae bacterium]|nr:DinB family protein [Anaerolineae bacterium]
MKSEEENIRTGRPRQYKLHPTPGFAHPDVALSVAALDELSARLFDLLADLPQDALDFVPEGGTNSISMLTLHIINAEMYWVQWITQTTIPEQAVRHDLEQSLQLGQQAASGELPPSSTNLATLQELCQRVRVGITIPALAPITTIDDEIVTPQRTMTARGVLMHLLWHWTYHTGQVGMLRRLWGARYRWTFEKSGTTQ